VKQECPTFPAGGDEFIGKNVIVTGGTKGAGEANRPISENQTRLRK